MSTSETNTNIDVIVKINDDLNALKDLPENWNGYGAKPINIDIIKSAKEFFTKIASYLVSTPQVVPMTRGRLQLEWHRGSKSLELEFTTPQQIHYLQWDSEKNLEEENIISVNDTEQALKLLQWFEENDESRN